MSKRRRQMGGQSNNNPASTTAELVPHTMPKIDFREQEQVLGDHRRFAVTKVTVDGTVLPDTAIAITNAEIVTSVFSISLTRAVHFEVITEVDRNVATAVKFVFVELMASSQRFSKTRA